MSRFSDFFGLQQPTDKAVKLVRLMVLFMPTMAATYTISTTFWMIYIAESLGGGDYYAGLGLVGVLIVIQLVVQTVLDYPSGALGDHIGQRYIIGMALMAYAVAFWMTSIVDQSSPFLYFVIIYVLMGVGQSQESGAWGAWFDNNYRVAMPHDKDRKMYGMMQGRMGMIFQIVSTLVLLPGAWLAVLYSRVWVFRLQAAASVVLAVVVFKIVRDFPEAEAIRKKQNAESGGYVRVLKDGVRFLVSSRFVAFSIFGETILWATGTLWWQLLLFPLYFTYLVTDVAVSGYRTLVFIPNVASQERSGIWSRRFDPIKWVPRLRLMQFCGVVFYLALAFTTFYFAGASEEAERVALYLPFTSVPLFEVPVQSIIPLVLIFIIFTIGDFLGAFADVLSQRVMIDVIPNRIRNSLYSLRPTLAVIFAMFLIPFFSTFLPAYGFGPTFALVTLVALAGTILVKIGYSNPVPRSYDIQTVEPNIAANEPEIATQSIEDST